ncbi:MAG: hypothetical protein ACP5GR_04210, partial [Thermoplasmata archaeon]
MRIMKVAMVGLVLLIILGISITSASFADQNNQTFVILVNGYTVSGNGYWMMGVDIYQQLVNAGYTVGIMSYYGPFVI